MKADFYLGAWLVQPSLGRMSFDGRTVQVRPKVMDLLAYLAGSPGTVISKETLLNDVWGTEAISESALTRTVSELRDALDDDAPQPRFLETIPKRGYRLIADVRPAVSPEESNSHRRRARALAISGSRTSDRGIHRASDTRETTRRADSAAPSQAPDQFARPRRPAQFLAGRETGCDDMEWRSRRQFRCLRETDR